MNKRYRKYLIMASILLHVLFLLMWETAVKYKIFDFNLLPAAPVETAPIVFDLQPEKPSEVIETPDDAKTVEKQDKADFLSDKNALARDAEAAPDVRIDDPYARGDFESHDLSPMNAPVGEQPLPPEEQENAAKAEKVSDFEPDISMGEFIREQMEKQQQNKPQGVRQPMPGVLHDNQDSKSLDTGGLSFNTYNWDFAPYMLALKKRIGQNIYPPPAFTMLGLINGSTICRFRIYPDGRMEDLKVLRYQGHKSLMQTSHTAIEISAPFPPLPRDFPEPYLEVTCRFSYLIRKQR